MLLFPEISIFSNSLFPLEEFECELDINMLQILYSRRKRVDCMVLPEQRLLEGHIQRSTPGPVFSCFSECQHLLAR